MRTYHGIADFKIEVTGSTPATYPTDGLLARWTFDSTLGDSAGGNKTLILKKGAVAYDTGKVGNCLKCDGDDGVYTADASIMTIFQARNTWSVSFWGVEDASRTGSGQHYFWACSKNADQSPYTRSQVSSEADGLRINCARFQSSPAIGQYTTSVSPSPMTWFHHVSVFDGTYLWDYFNGTVNSSTAGDTDNMGTSNNEFGIGYRPQSTNNLFCLIGKIDSLYVYNRVLTASEVSQLYNGGAGI
jgi:hypothetical protein